MYLLCVGRLFLTAKQLQKSSIVATPFYTVSDVSSKSSYTCVCICFPSTNSRRFPCDFVTFLCSASLKINVFLL